jgi:hypothetical protein
MLNDSDELFSSGRNDAPPGSKRGWSGSKEWLLQGREQGFVPYWWDDGSSVSLDILNRLARKGPDHIGFPGTNLFAGKPNPEARLSGYSHGSSSHMAQDLAGMLQLTWLLFRESDQKLAAEIAEASRHLQESRTRHGNAGIPAVVAALALSNRDVNTLHKLPADTWQSVRQGKNHFVRAVVTFAPGQPESVPGFADDQQYRYYVQLARTGALTEAAAWKTIFDAFTEPQLYRLYCDDVPPPPGINVFDLHPYQFLDGKPADFRSQRKGPNNGPRPIGSRFGPQNMICCGWAIQSLRAFPGVWEKGLAEFSAEALGLPVLDKANPAEPPGFWKTSAGVETWLRRELGGGLRTWEAIFDQYGYIPTGIGTQSVLPGIKWDEFSDTGGYAHLLSAAAQWLHCLENKRDWEQHRLPRLLPEDSSP